MTSPTATQLLDAAQTLVEDRGFNAFSYKDLSAAVGIRTASIHYHFPAKADLGEALMERYLEQLESALDDLDRRSRTHRARLKAFIELYRGTEARGAICLCGSLASDLETLPGGLREQISTYLDRSESWVARTLAGGVRAGEFTLSAKPAELAATLVAGLQGGLIVGRARGASVLDHVQRGFLRSITSA